MAFVPADQRELFLPLIEGIHEDPPWQTFMRNLAGRTSATQVLLIVALADAPRDEEPTVLRFAASRAAKYPAPDISRMARLGLHPLAGLRPERVYSLDELLDFGDPRRLAAQRHALDRVGIRAGRVVRVPAGPSDAWLALIHDREDFAASDAATLSAVVPHLAVALRAQARLAAMHLRLQLAEGTLARLGTGQLALDRDGRVMAADPHAEAMLPLAAEPTGRPGRRLQLLPDIARQLESACAAIADGKPDENPVVALDRHGGLFLLLRRANLVLPGIARPPAVIAAVRSARTENPRRAVAAIASVYGLSAREAALAHRLMRGQSIVEAGASLRLTVETARNYSKRIYAKTGARGQADLVRILLRGLAPLA